MNPTKRKLRIAIQKNGRLKEPSIEFLRSLNFVFNLNNGGKYLVSCENYPLEILLVRNVDIPEYVKNGVADFGIIGQNILFERKDSIKVLRKLGFGRCRLVIAAPRVGRIKSAGDLRDERIATSYPDSLKKFLAKRGISAAVINIKGSVEITPSIGLADAICDITQTGETLRQHGLKTIATIIKSEAVLIVGPNAKYSNLLYLVKKRN